MLSNPPGTSISTSLSSVITPWFDWEPNEEPVVEMHDF
jgi:hypothetical protein